MRLHGAHGDDFAAPGGCPAGCTTAFYGAGPAQPDPHTRVPGLHKTMHAHAHGHAGTKEALPPWPSAWRPARGCADPRPRVAGCPAAHAVLRCANAPS